MENLTVRPYHDRDERDVIDLWSECHLFVPSNNPKRDIERKLQVNPELLLVGLLGTKIVVSCMAGYEGHRGWINYLAVAPRHRRKGFARKIMEEAEKRLKEKGCPKINIQIRASNNDVVSFYENLGFSDDRVLSMGKRIKNDPPYELNGKSNKE